MMIVFYCVLCVILFVVVVGDGIEIIDLIGKCYIDVCGGVVVLCFGYSNQCVIDVIKWQVQ